MATKIVYPKIVPSFVGDFVTASDFDETGFINILAVVGKVAYCLIRQYNAELRQLDAPFQKGLSVVQGINVKIDKQLFNLTYPGKSIPLHLLLLSHDSKTATAATRCSLQHSQLGINLATFDCMILKLDPKTRRPMNIPENVAEIMQGGHGLHVQLSECFEAKLAVPLAADAYELSYTVKEEDIDERNHLSFIVYDALIFQALTASNLQGDPSRRVVSHQPDVSDVEAGCDLFQVGSHTILGGTCLHARTEFTNRYLSEVFLGDTLSVNIWSDEKQPGLLHTRVLKGENVVFSNASQFEKITVTHSHI